MAVKPPVPSARRVHLAAVRLFAERGFHGTGIRDLAKTAGLSTASLYHYMGTKEDLLAGIMRDCLLRLRDAAQAAVDGGADPAQRVGRLVALHVMTHALRPDETRVVDGEVGALSTAARQPVMRLRDDYEQLWTDAIEQGINDGTFDTTEPGVTRLALLEMCNGVARWYTPGGRLSVEQVAAHYAHLALRSLGDPDADPDLAPCLRILTDIWPSEAD